MLNDYKKISSIIVALDFNNKNDALLMAKKLDPSLCNLKVGLELFLSCGPSIIDELHNIGYKIFLDLKFHDIANTVVKSCMFASKLGVWMTNIHASAGKKTILSAAKELSSTNKKMILLGVTILTSLDDSDLVELGYKFNIENQILKMSDLCFESGLNGIVCSANEAKFVKSKFEKNFICVCPGIRMLDDNKNDQKRVSTPSIAKSNGADYIVVGRSITTNPNPLDSLIKIKNEFDGI